MSALNLTISHRGTAYSLSLLPDDLLADLYTKLEELTGVPPHLQKLLYKGKSAKDTVDTSIRDAGIKEGLKIQLLGTTTRELGEMHAAENEQQRRERILRERTMKGPTKVGLHAYTQDCICLLYLSYRSDQQVLQAAKPLHTVSTILSLYLISPILHQL